MGDTSAAHALAESFLDVTPDVTPRGADGETHEAALHSLRNVSGGNNPLSLSLSLSLSLAHTHTHTQTHTHTNIPPATYCVTSGSH